MKLWNDKRLRISITRLGMQFVAAMLLMGAFAVNTGNNLLYMLFSIMLGFFLVSGWASRKAIRDLAFVRIEEGNLFARVRGGLRLCLRDGAPRRTRGLEVHLELENGRVEPGFFAGGGGGAREVWLVLNAHPGQRGPCRLGTLELRTSFPFGLMEKAWCWKLDQELLILPHPRSLLPALAREGGEPRPRPRAGSSGPDGARPFRERDSPSRMHWKRTAQRGAPWIRTFEDEEPAGLQLHLDLRAWPPGTPFERELEILSGRILQARLQRREVGLTVSGPGGSKACAGFAPCWRALALAQAAGHRAAIALP